MKHILPEIAKILPDFAHRTESRKFDKYLWRSNGASVKL